MTMYTYNRTASAPKTAGEGDDQKVIFQAEAWLGELELRVKQAKQELIQKREPGSRMGALMGQLKGYQSTDWYERWFH